MPINPEIHLLKKANFLKVMDLYTEVIQFFLKSKIQKGRLQWWLLNQCLLRSTAGSTRTPRWKFTFCSTSSAVKLPKKWSQLISRTPVWKWSCSTLKEWSTFWTLQSKNFKLSFRLYEKIEAKKSKFQVRPNKISITLHKWLETSWKELAKAPAGGKKKSWAEHCTLG